MKKPERPAQFPAATYKKWTRELGFSWYPEISAEGSFHEIKKQVSGYSAWNDMKPILEALKAEAQKAKVEGLTFSAQRNYSRYRMEDAHQVRVIATGYQRKTEKEMIAGEIARDRNHNRKQEALRKKAEAEKKELLKLMARYPELAK